MLKILSAPVLAASVLAVIEEISITYQNIVLAGNFNSNVLLESHLADQMQSIGF